MAKINPELQNKLTKVVSKIFINATGKWTSAKDFAFSKICEEYDVDRRYSTAICKVLREKGLFFSEGEKSGMKYKIAPNVNSNVHSVIATQVIEQYRADIKAYNDSRKSSDCKPPQRREEKVEVMPATFIKRTVPHLDDRMFVLLDCQVVEGRIVGKRYNPDNEKILLFDAQLPSRNETEKVIMKDIPLSQLFESTEALISHLQRHIIKFKR